MSDSTVEGTVDVENEPHVIEVSATKLKNDEPGQIQRFKFTIDGGLEENEAVHFNINHPTKDIKYSETLADWEILTPDVDGTISNVSPADNPTVTLRATDDIPCGTEMEVRPDG